MILVEKHIIRKSDPNWKQIDKMCFIGKNVWNQAVYKVRRHFEETGEYLDFYKLDKIFRAEPEMMKNYSTIPNNVSQQILRVLHSNYKTYFTLIKKYKKNPKLLSGLPKPPGYKDKEKGRAVLGFPNTLFSIKKGKVHFPKKMQMKPLSTKVEKAKYMRIVPQRSCYVIEICYEVKSKPIKEEIRNVAGMDLGVNNLVSIAVNEPGIKPLLINGKPLKSMNQYFNKKKADMQSLLMKNHKKHWSKKLDSLSFKRNNKVIDYLHKSSRMAVDYCVQHGIDTIVIGHNKEWKQEVNMGRKNNQTFLSIPHSILISQIKYKAELEGIKVIEYEESYTSKVDHLSLEEMKHHDEYMGKRVKRGLFKSGMGAVLNADVNGSIGIIRKVIGDDFLNLLDRGCVAQPVKVNPLRRLCHPYQRLCHPLRKSFSHV